MAKKHEEMTDEELAQLVADKVAEHPAFTGALSQMKPEEKDDFGRTQAQADQETADQTKPPTAVHEVPDEKLKAEADSDAMDKNLAAQVAKAGTQGAGKELPARAGVIYLANTDEKGKQTKGQMVARKMFATDEDFDKFVSDAKAKGHLWEGAPDAQPAGEGGGFLQQVKKGLKSIVGGATPSGAEGGTGTASDRRGGSTGQAQTIDYGGASRPAGSDQGALATPGEQAQPLMQHVSQYNDQITPGVQKVVDAVAGSGPEYRYSAFSTENNAGPFGLNKDGTNKSIGTAIGEKLGPMPGAPAAAVQTQGPNVPPVTEPGSVGIRAKQSLGAGMPKIAMDQTQANLNPELKAAADMQMQAIGHGAEIASKRDQAISDVQNNASDIQWQNQQRAEAKQNAVAEGQARMMQAMTDAQNVLNNPAKTPDPERYWKNHSRVMFAIGVGLLAQAGKDINGVLSSVNQAIDRDVEEQKQEFEAPRNAAKGKLATAQTMYSMFRDMGHDAFEAQKMAAATLKDRTVTEIAKITAASDSELVRANGAQRMGELQMAVAKDMQDALQHNATNAISKFSAESTDAFHRGELGLKSQELRLKADEIGTTKNAISDADAKKLSDSVTTLGTLAQAGEIFKPGMGSTVYNAFTAMDPTATTDAAQFNSLRPIYARILANVISPTERATETQIKNVLDTMIPKAGAANAYQLWNAPGGALDIIKKRLGGEADALRSKGRGAKVDQIMGGAKQPGKTPLQGTLPDGRKVVITD